MPSSISVISSCSDTTTVASLMEQKEEMDLWWSAINIPHTASRRDGGNCFRPIGSFKTKGFLPHTAWLLFRANINNKWTVTDKASKRAPTIYSGRKSLNLNLDFRNWATRKQRQKPFVTDKNLNCIYGKIFERTLKDFERFYADRITIYYYAEKS